ncbi:MAG: hypothetical protein JRJ31_16920 [Deltaproteobacteria bacterium]|nr:hypothetical protein [Deltaproteobacteria bacterium]
MHVVDPSAIVPVSVSQVLLASLVVLCGLSLLTVGLIKFILGKIIKDVESEERVTSDMMKSIKESIDVLGRSFVEYKDSWPQRREALLETFDHICDRKQEACSKLMEQRITNSELSMQTTLASIQSNQEHLCGMVEGMRKEIDAKWKEIERNRRELSDRIDKLVLSNRQSEREFGAI